MREVLAKQPRDVHGFHRYEAAAFGLRPEHEEEFFLELLRAIFRRLTSLAAVISTNTDAGFSAALVAICPGPRRLRAGSISSR